MCLKKPKPPAMPPTTETAADKALSEELALRRGEGRTERSLGKAARFEDQLAQLSGGFGRRSLLSGGAGGMGFDMPMMRSLFTTVR
jgi:hypothetical protein